MKKDFPLSKITRFRVGGTADYLFQPNSPQELAEFLRINTLPITVIGSASNILVRDGGIRGVVVKLGKGFSFCKLDGDKINVGGATSNRKLVNFCKDNNIGGFEFLYHIPSTIGGALYMNAGAYGGDISKVIISAELMDRAGGVHKMSASELGYIYRKCGNLPEGWIFLSAEFKWHRDSVENIEAKIAEYTERRGVQPIWEVTCGSTFKNPSKSISAWKIIDESGCRGLRVGGAEMSQKHCNFIINDGTATAEDIEKLGEEVRRRVKEKTGVSLEWEIQILGDFQ